MGPRGGAGAETAPRQRATPAGLSLSIDLDAPEGDVLHPDDEGRAEGQRGDDYSAARDLFVQYELWGTRRRCRRRTWR